MSLAMVSETSCVVSAGADNLVHMWSGMEGVKLGTLDLQDPSANMGSWRFKVVEYDDNQRARALKEVRS
jgi:hypothetical protein